MDLFELTRRLVDIESVTGSEGPCGVFLGRFLEERGFPVEPQPVENGRFNLFAAVGEPRIVLSTHMDTVPPFVPSSEDSEFIHGRGSCDAKGILAAQVKAAERLRDEGIEGFALLFLVGEEVTSDGAQVANQRACGSKFIVSGEPTGNKLALGSKGILRVDIRTRGRMAHSAYPHLGESAIEKLLDLLGEIRRLPLASDEVLGPSTMNIGIIRGGRAANVVPDEAEAQVLFRTVNGASKLRAALEKLLRGRAEFEFTRQTPALRMEKLDGFETDVVAFTTDLPSLTRWGRPLLLGPGSIDVAHTDHERVSKAELTRAVELYVRLVKDLRGKV